MSDKLKNPMDMTKAELFCSVFRGASYLVLVTMATSMFISFYDGNPQTSVTGIDVLLNVISLFFFLVIPRITEND